MARQLLWFTVMCFMLSIAACGGGQAPSNSLLAAAKSTTQINFEANAVADSFAEFYVALPSGSTPPIPGLNHAYYDLWSSPASPDTGPQTSTTATEYLLAKAVFGKPTFSPDCVLKNRVIYTRTQDSKVVWSYAGADVLASTYATDQMTVVDTIGFDSWSAPSSLTGSIASTTILRSLYRFISAANSSANFDLGKPWLSGSAYSKRTGYQKYDTLWVLDWPGSAATATCAVNTYTGAGSMIEDVFSSAAVVAAGGIVVDSVVYSRSAGDIGFIEGARAWVAKAKRPNSVNPTDSYAVVFELNGRVYLGSLWKAGTRFKSIDLIDSTVLNDFSIGLNKTAAESIKSAAKF